MAYKVLYRKYRPQDFNTLFGQNTIKKLLIDSIINDKISHAYLFSGPRGTGKTSTAKLFAKTINCENPKDGIPCNKCMPCINYEQSPDIIEIDAASNNGVDEIRDLRDNAKILPAFSKYKVYIIDEVHMLSQSAWNAFLKILEEPPKHVIFILATTEIQKIPITILSRCQRFNFQKISVEIIAENILRISKLEKIKINQEAANYIASLADGGMRDALSLLDQLSKEEKEITVDLIKESFGVLTENEVEEIFNCLSKGDIKKLEGIFDEYSKKGLDTNLLISKILNYLYTLEIGIVSGKKHFLSIDQIKTMANELIKCYNKQDALLLIKMIIVSNISQIISQEKNPEIISREIISKPTEVTSEKEESAELKIESKPVISDDIKKIRINNAFVGASKQEKEKFKKSWEIFINKEIDKSNVEMLSLLEDLSIEVVSPTNVLFSIKSSSTALLYNEKSNLIEEELLKSEKINIKTICLTDDEWQKEKKQFIKNKDKEYSYIDEPKINEDVKIIDSALDIFAEEIVEVN